MTFSLLLPSSLLKLPNRETTTATASKTLLENITSFYLCSFAIISTHSTCIKTATYPGTKLEGVELELWKRMKNSPLCAHVLHKLTLNSRWSFHVVVLHRTAEKCTKIQNARAEQLLLLIKPIVLRRRRYLRHRRCLSSLLTHHSFTYDITNYTSCVSREVSCRDLVGC